MSNREKPERTGKRRNYPVNRRTKEQVLIDLDEAVASMAIKHGFENMTMTGVANIMGLSPISVKNRYDTLEELLTAYVKRYDFWLNSIINKHHQEFEEGDHELFLKNLLKGIAKALRKDLVMQQLLIWETQKPNNITKRTAMFREAHTAMYNGFYKKYFGKTNVNFNAFMAIMIAGIYYLILHKETSTFCGIDLNARRGKEILNETIDGMCTHFFDQIRPSKKVLAIAKKLKEEGVSSEIISNSTGLTIEQINNLDQLD